MKKIWVTAAQVLAILATMTAQQGLAALQDGNTLAYCGAAKRCETTNEDPNCISNLNKEWKKNKRSVPITCTTEAPGGEGQPGV